jgi:hypothetical protein
MQFVPWVKQQQLLYHEHAAPHAWQMLAQIQDSSSTSNIRRLPPLDTRTGPLHAKESIIYAF